MASVAIVSRQDLFDDGPVLRVVIAFGQREIEIAIGKVDRDVAGPVAFSRIPVGHLVGVDFTVGIRDADPIVCRPRTHKEGLRPIAGREVREQLGMGVESFLAPAAPVHDEKIVGSGFQLIADVGANVVLPMLLQRAATDTRIHRGDRMPAVLCKSCELLFDVPRATHRGVNE